MKRLLTTILITILLATFITIPAFALDLDNGLLQPAQETSGYDPATQTSFAEQLGRVVQTILSFVGIVFLSLMVYAGYLWMTARGESEPVDKAKKIITAAIIGLVITIGAYSITAFIVPALLATQSS